MHVSIHASVKDATLLFLFLLLLLFSFNPRICKRCDKTTEHNKITQRSFNPRICKRCDQLPILMLGTVGGFNPRICKRCDFGSATKQGDLPVSIHASVKDATYFYQHQHEAQGVSIHASVKDATASSFYNIDSGLVSIHASVKDATTGTSGRYNIITFQSTHL